jgi:hypothetical protein
MPTTFTTTLYDAQKADRANPSRLAAPNLASGTVEFAVARYTLTAGTDEAAADLINLCVLPAGAIPIPHLSKVVCDADPGTAFTIDVGTADNPDGWGDAIALTTAGIIEFVAAAHTMPAWLAPTPIVPDAASGNAIVYATVVTSTAPVAGVNIDFVLAYKRGR